MSLCYILVLLLVYCIEGIGVTENLIKTMLACLHVLTWIDAGGSLQWRHNERYGVRPKKTSKLCVIGLCEGNSPVTVEFRQQKASNAENVSIWWRHHVVGKCSLKMSTRAGFPTVWYSLMAKHSPNGWSSASHGFESVLPEICFANNGNHIVKMRLTSYLHWWDFPYRNTASLYQHVEAESGLYASVNYDTLSSDKGLSPVWHQAMI